MKRILAALRRAPRWVPTATAALVGVLAAAGMAVVVKEAGYGAGFAPGQSAGYAEGYSVGYAAGERRAERRSRGLTDVEDLPAGADRAAASAAEAADQAYAFLSPRPEAGCTVMVRLPAGGVIGLPDNVGDVGAALDNRYYPCSPPSGMRPPGYAAPTVADLPRRWEQAISGGRSFAYRVGDAVRIDVFRCTGYVIPLPVPAGGVAVPETAPSVSRSSVCNKPR